MSTEKGATMALEAILPDGADTSAADAEVMLRAQAAVPVLERTTGDFLRGALQAASAEGWRDDHAQLIAAAGVRQFVHAMFDGADVQAAFNDAFETGRSSLKGDLMRDAVGKAGDQQAAFRSVMEVLRQNDLRAGNAGQPIPEAWMDAAAKAAARVAAAGGTSLDQVTAGLNRAKNLALDASLDEALGYS